MAAAHIQVGDAISVYWDGDKKWYSGEILEIDEQGNCHIQYEDGEQERLNLGDVKYRTGKNWKGCLRGKKNNVAKNPFRAIQEILFDIEDRLPPNGVLKNQMQWWNKWHCSVSEAAASQSIKEISKAALEIALQIKKTVTTPWWSSNQAEWKKRTKTATTVPEMDLLVKELRSKVVDWTAARQLWEAQEQKAWASHSSNLVERTDGKYVKEFRSKEEDNLNVINMSGSKSDKEMQQGKEILLKSDREMQQAKEILLMEERVDNDQNNVLHETQGEEEFDLGKENECHRSTKIETFAEKADDVNHLLGSENSKETSQSAKWEGKHVCILTNSIQDSSPQQNNCNVGTKQEYKSVKVKEGAMVAGSHDIQALQQKTKVTDDSYIEVLCKQERLQETLPELRRSPRIGLKSFLMQRCDKRISHKQNNHLERSKSSDNHEDEKMLNTNVLKQMDHGVTRKSVQVTSPVKPDFHGVSGAEDSCQFRRPDLTDNAENHGQSSYFITKNTELNAAHCLKLGRQSGSVKELNENLNFKSLKRDDCHADQRNTAEGNNFIGKDELGDNAEDHDKSLKVLKLDCSKVEATAKTKSRAMKSSLKLNSDRKILSQDSDHIQRRNSSHDADYHEARKKLRWVKSASEDLQGRNSAEDGHDMEIERLCHNAENNNMKLSSEPPVEDLPTVKAKKNLQRRHNILKSRKLASPPNDTDEGKGHFGCLVGLKSNASENEVSIGSPACSRDGHLLSTIPVIRKRKRTSLSKNVDDKSARRNRERWRFQLTNESMTLKFIRIKNTFTATNMKNGDKKPKDIEVSSTIEGTTVVAQLCDGSNVCGSSSTTDPVEVILDDSMLGYICSICQFEGADNLLLLCDGKKCSCSVHTFCLQPPLLGVPEGEWLCPYCKDSPSLNSKTVNKGGNIYPQKKIERILGRRQVQVGTEAGGIQLQYLVKWISLSHHHDTWVPESWVLHHDRSRVLNFQRKFPLTRGSESISVDERKPEWLKIDRVIACREKAVNCDSKCEIEKSKLSSSEKRGKYEFLVKWMALDYCDATWEDSCNEELLGTADKLVERHKKANERDEIHSRNPVSASIKAQPSYLKGGILHDYQLQGMKWLLNNFEQRRNVILADEMGLGKTIQAIAFIVCMKTEQLSSKPVLVIAPKSTLPGWDQEFRRWALDINVILYQGDRESRSCIREHEFYTPNNRVLFDVLVTSYELAMIDSTVLQKLKWSSIIVDEGHRIKNFHSRLATLLKQQATDFRLLLTGTPLQNTLTELFALLHFLDPSEVPDPEFAACAFSEIGTSSDQSDSEKTREQILRIHDLLQPRMLRRLKSEVLRDMIPGKRLMEVSCALTIPQRRLYVNLLKKNYKELNKGIPNGRKRSLNSLLVDLKICCNHPYIFPGQEPSNITGEKAFKLLVESSGKLQLLEKLLPRLKEDGHRVLLFSQMTRMLDLLEDFLTFLGFSFYRIDGKTSASERQQTIKNFNGADSDVFVFLISTRAGGLGINLPSADTVIIYDPDFNPFVDLQAQSRAHRIGQEKAVIVYQLITKCSIEEKILQRSRRKLAMENLVMNPVKGETFKELHDVLLHGARNILDEQDIEATSIHYTNEDIEILLNREIKIGEDGTSEENGYLGAIQGVPVVQDEEAKRPVIGKEWEELLGPVIEDADEEEELGRGKRQRKEVTYACDPISDDDEEYSPSSSNSSSDGSASVGKDNNRKIRDGEVTSGLEITPEQYEDKPQIGSFAERESSFGSSTFTHNLFSSNSACLSKPVHLVSEAKFTSCGLMEGNDRNLTQKMQSELSMTGNQQEKIISCSVTSKTGVNKSIGFHTGQTNNILATKSLRFKEDNLIESRAHESLYANDLNTANRHVLPTLLRHSESILHNVSQPSMVQVFDSGDMLTVLQKSHLLPRKNPSLSHISRVTGQDSNLGDQVVSCPGINPLISQIDKRVDAILERVSQSVQRNGNLNADETGSSPSLANITASKNLSHFNQKSLSAPKLDQVMQSNHLSPHNKKENG